MTTVTDDFNRADGDLGTTNWEMASGGAANSYQIVSQQVHWSANSTRAQWKSNTFGVNQRAKVTVKVLPSAGNQGPGPSLRSSGYLANLTSNGAQLRRGLSTTLASYSGGLSVGDTVELRCIDNTTSVDLEVLRNGSVVLSFTDSSPPAAGNKVGFAMASGNPTAFIDDWEGGDYTPATAATTYTLEGPSTGTVGVASSNFTVTPDAAVSADVVVTPSGGGDGGTFSPTTVTFASGTSTAQTFTYTPASAGVKTISTTNDGSLTDPSSLSFTASAASSVTIPVFMHHYRQQGIS